MNTLLTRKKFLRAFAFSCAPLILYGYNYSKQGTLPRIGFLSGAGVWKLEDAFTDELEKLGFKDGENIRIEKRLARPNSSDVAVMATELSQMDLSLIVVGSLPIALEVRKNNQKMPLVLATCPGMVSNGFAQSLEHPGGIYTGIDELPLGVTVKRVQLLKAAAPKVTRIALLSTTPGIGGHDMQLLEAEKTASTLGLKVKPYRATNLPQLEKALQELAADDMNGLLNFQGALTLANRQLLVDFSIQHRIPAIFQQAVFTEIGGLMSWAPDLNDQFREAAHFVQKILKGANPGDLPIQHPRKYYLTLNATTAKKLGLNFTQELLEQASNIIN